MGDNNKTEISIGAKIRHLDVLIREMQDLAAADRNQARGIEARNCGSRMLRALDQCRRTILLSGRARKKASAAIGVELTQILLEFGTVRAKYQGPSRG